MIHSDTAPPYKTNQWNYLINIFGGQTEDNKVMSYAADNVYIAWPSIIRSIEAYCDRSARLKVLDFGCGGGLFCKKTSRFGF